MFLFFRLALIALNHDTNEKWFDVKDLFIDNDKISWKNI